MMKEEIGGNKDGRKEEDGETSATEDGRKKKIICPENGMTGVNPGAVAFGREYCYFLLAQITSLYITAY
jgi:hypothetical protein